MQNGNGDNFLSRVSKIYQPSGRSINRLNLTTIARKPSAFNWLAFILGLR